ncbi:MAG: cobalt-precorrin-6A reductase [Hyphomicrobiaceae bacterium]
MTRLLILGGTSDANALAAAVARADIVATYSYAGRTQVPVNQPLPVRIGGFGGPDGLAGYIRDEAITHVIDATHPFAGTMSCNAVEACAATGTPLIALVRPSWRQSSGDRWIAAADLAHAVDCLPVAPACVFLAIGRQHLEPFAAKPQHHYLLRFVDAPDGSLPLPSTTVIVARGPFTQEGDLEAMRANGVSWLVTRNSGGNGARAKIDAARELGLPVIMIERPPMPERLTSGTIDAVMTWLGHETRLGA